LAIIATLNTLLTADTSKFDQGIQKSESTAQRFGESVKQQGGLIAATLNRIGLGGAVALSQLGPVIGNIDGRLAAAWRTAGMFLSVITGMAGTGAQVATVFTSLASAASAAVGAAFNGVISGLTSAAGTVGGVIASALGAVVATVGSVALAIGSIVGGAFIAAGAVVGTLAGGFIAAAAAGTGLAIVLSHLGSEGAQSIASLNTLAKELGINVHALSAIANTSGLNPEGFTHSMLHMQRSIEEGSTRAARALDRMGLSLAELREQSPVRQLEAIYGAFRNLETQGQRSAAATALFGRSGITMLDSLSRGTEGLEAARARAERFGLTFTEMESALVRRSLRAWGQWSLAMEGVSRKLAVIFAPIWETLGNVGGNIGERLVALFSDREVVQSIHGLWAGIAEAGRSAWEGITSAVRSFWDDTLGLSGVNGDTLKDIFIKSMVTIEYLFKNIGPLANQAWLELKAAGLGIANEVLGIVNRIIMATNNLFFSIARQLNSLVAGYNATFGRLTGNNLDSYAITPNMPIDRTELQQMLQKAQELAVLGRGTLVDNYMTFMDERLRQIREGAAIMGNAADRATVAANAAAGGGRTAPGGNAAALFGSQEAFSILNGRQADLLDVARGQAESLRHLEQDLMDVRQRLGALTVIAVARL
jgi:hypothetical protein